jgi:hypothetical protein
VPIFFDDEMKRITVTIEKENHELIQRFRTEFMDLTKEDLNYTEALNWLLHFGTHTFFGKERVKDFRKRFYRAWATSPNRKEYAMDEFLRSEGFEQYIL